MSRSRGRAAVAGLGALLTLLALIVGLPVLLYRLGGSPLPGHLPGAAQVGRDLLHRDSASLVLAAVRDVSWIAWALFTLAVLAEVQAVARRRTAPRLRLGGMQAAAGRLVALAALTFTAAPMGTLLTSPPPVSTVLQADVTPMPSAHFTMTPRHPEPAQAPAPAPAPARPAPARPGRHAAAAPRAETVAAVASAGTAGAQAGSAQEEGMGFSQLVTVRSGDCLWSIAQQHLGGGDRFREIVALNLDHDMGNGQVFTNPSVIQPGWVLHLPAAPAGTQPGGGTPAPGPGGSGGSGGTHPAHPTSSPTFGQPHPSASAVAPSAPAASAPASVPTAPAPSAPAPARPSAPASAPAGQVTPVSPVASMSPAPESRLPLGFAFGTGVLAGGAAASLARLRHRQRQTRRRGRRIPVPASAPVALAEQRLNVTADQESVTALRAVLRHLAASLVATPQQLPEITALLVRPDALEIQLASPAAEPPPPPFTVIGGRQGTAWQLDLDGEPPALAADDAGDAGDLLPGLLTIGTTDGGYLLADLEHLGVTAVDGPASMTAAVLRAAAAELATGQLAGWYDLILVGFPELAALGGRGSCCDTLDAGLDLLAAKAVALRRRLGDSPVADVRYHRLADPDDEDWALTLLVSSVPPTAGQLALLSDLSGDPGGVAALVPGGTAAAGGHRPPATISLSAGPVGSDALVARIWPLQLEVRARGLDDADYEALTSLFVTATEPGDLGPADPPYDSWLWPPDLADGADPASGPAAFDESYHEDGGPAADGSYLEDRSYSEDGGDPAARGYPDDGAADEGGPADFDPAILDARADEDEWSAEPAQLGGHWAAPNWGGDQGWAAPDTAAAVPDLTAVPGWGGDEQVPAADDADPDAAGEDETAAPEPAAVSGWADDGDPAADDAGPGAAGWAGAAEDAVSPVAGAEMSPAGSGPGDFAEAGDQPDQAGDHVEDQAGDPAVSGLPGEPAAWLSEPSPARPGEAAGPAGAAAAAAPPEPAGDPAAALDATLRIGVLGTFTINGQPGALLPAQSQLVLALALNGTSGLSNQQLCYLLGADPDRPKPSDSLRQLIVRTRRQLGRAPDRREWIEHLGGGQYALHPLARFDWHEFDALATEGIRARDAHRLRRALGLIRGRPFTGCYYWWLDLALTETVRAQIVDAADVLAAEELAAGDPAAAGRAARVGLAGDAGAEQLWRALMRAEHAAGNRSGVREAWSRCLDAISEIAPDGEPHPDTAAAYRELLGDAPARPAWAGGAAP